MKRTLRTTVIALATASVLALLEILRTTMARMFESRPRPVADLAVGVIPMWITVVVVSPWCAFMARRFPFRAGHVGRAIVAHSVGASVFAVLQMTLLLAIHTIHGAHVVLPFMGLLHRYVFYIVMQMSLYAAIVMVVLLVDARAEAAERRLATAQLERSLAAARLESLQAQIRPHFLFNTLNALAVLARKGDGAAVDRAIGDLGELLRASFDASARSEILLGEELDFLERYVHLQRIRFPDRLVVEWAVADEARRALVPALLVQPLVENAIEHGVATVRGGRVHVAARREGQTLAIEVTDDGPGFRIPESVPAEGERGVGLANTRERLALLYGERGSLVCGNRPEGGGVVRIRIPWRETGGAPA